MTNAVAFMTWNRIVAWKVLSMRAYPNELIPVGYGARQCAYWDSLKRGSRIWVVTRISGKLSLAGCVTVRKMLESDNVTRRDRKKGIDELLKAWPFVAEAEPSKSEFFETNSAQPVIDDLGIKFSQGAPIAYFEHSLRRAFGKCMRQGRNSLFLSYTWDDTRRFAVLVAGGLRRKRVSSWLDAWTMPKYRNPKDEKREKISESRLKALIRLGIRNSKAAVVINSKGYG
jgi:hypothetical protein